VKEKKDGRMIERRKKDRMREQDEERNICLQSIYFITTKKLFLFTKSMEFIAAESVKKFPVF
jgi:hypothetical protein